MAQGMYHRAKPPTSQRGYIRLVIHTRKQKHSSSFIKQALTLTHPAQVCWISATGRVQPVALSEFSARDTKCSQVEDRDGPYP